jgi:flavin reductase (DIM6/NTAB) family NADH-FMN oxidoreductase RutF
MKIELPLTPPEHVKEQWPGQFSVFSYYSFVVDVPSPVFIITTLKESGLANAALSAWGMMAGSGKEPKFLLQVHNYTESRRLIESTGEFVVNFPSLKLKREMRNTVKPYDGNTDEILASGLTHEPSSVVKPPRVAECFASLECRVEWVRDVETHDKVSTLVQAAIVHASIDEDVLHDSLVETHARRQWVYDIQESINPQTGAAQTGVFASLDLANAVDLNELW